MLAGVMEIQLAADVARLADGMKKAESLVGGAMGRIRSAADGAMRVLGGIAAGLSVAAFSNWVRGAINAADEASKLAQKMGVATGDVAGLQLAFQLAGLEANTASTSIARLSKSLVEPNKGIQALGINLRTTGGAFKDTKDVLYEVADRIAKMPDGLQKTALAVEIFGRAGADLVPLLNGGAQGMREMDDMARKLGLTIDTETGKQAEQFNDTLELLGLGAQGVARQIAAQMLPTLTSLAGSFLESMTSGDKLKKTADFLGSGLRLLYSIAIGVVEVFSTVGKVWGGITAAIVAGLRGDFTGAWNILKAMKEDIGTGWADTARSISRAWTEEGNAAVAATAKLMKPQRDLLADAKAREAAAKAAAAEAKRAATEFDALLAKQSGVDPDFLQKLKNIAAQGAMRGFSADEIKKMQEAYIAQQPYMLKAAKEREQALKAEADAMQQLLDLQAEYNQATAADSKSREQFAMTVYGQTKALDDMGEQLALEAKLLGATDAQRRVAIEGLRIEQQLRKELEALKSNPAFNQSQRDSAAAELRANAERAKGLAEQRAALDEYMEMWDSIERTAHDVFVNVFEDGAGTFKRLGQTLKAALLDMLYQMTVKKWILNIQANVMGSGGVAAAGSGMLSSLFGGGGSPLSSIGGLFQGLTGSGGLFSGAGIGGFSGGLGALFGTGGGASALATSAGALEAGVMVSGVGGTAGALGGALGAIGAAMPYLGAALAVVSALGLFDSKGGPKAEGYFNPYDSGKFFSSNSSDAASASRTAAQGLQAQYDAILKSYGRTGGLQFGLGFSTDPKGDAPTMLQIGAGMGGVQKVGIYRDDIGREEADLQRAIAEEGARAVLIGLQQADIGGQIGDFLASLGDVAGLAADKVTEAINRVNKAGTERQQLMEQLFQLTHTEQEILERNRELELSAVDESNRALMERVHALQDERAAIESFTTSAADLRRFLSDLNMGPLALLSPEAQYMATRQEFQRLASLDLTNPERVAGLEGAGRAFLEASQGYNASSMAYFTDLASVKGVVGSSITAIDAQLTIAQAHLEVGRQQVAELQRMVQQQDAMLARQEAQLAQHAAGYQQQQQETVELRNAITGITRTFRLTQPVESVAPVAQADYT